MTGENESKYKKKKNTRPEPLISSAKSLLSSSFLPSLHRPPLPSLINCVCQIENSFLLHLELADLHFMDNRTPRNEAAEEVTRESLIAISYSLPDKVVDSKLSSGNLNGEKQIERIGSDGAEKYRSELISISSSQSPDDQGLPSSLTGLKN
ncbi:hypothetical protein V6N13_067320 [Hibiscus sabdariffa]